MSAKKGATSKIFKQAFKSKIVENKTTVQDPEGKTDQDQSETNSACDTAHDKPSGKRQHR